MHPSTTTVTASVAWGGGEMPVGRWLEADVVVDVANLAHAIAHARGSGGRREPSLVLLAHLLGGYGIDVRSFTVVLPTRPFVGLGRTLSDLRVTGAADRTSDEARAEVRRRLDEAEIWVARERTALAEAELPGLRVIEGALTGLDRGGERSVDELAVLAALHLVWMIPDEAAFLRTPDRPARGVVLVSEDRDVATVASEVAAGRPLYTLAGHTRDRSRQARRREDAGARPWLLVPEAALAALADRTVKGRAVIDEALADLTVCRGTQEDDARIRLRLGADRNLAASSPMPTDRRRAAPTGSWEWRRERAKEGARTIAVVDEYGLQRVGQRALGAAFLPEPDDVRTVLIDHAGFNGEVAHLAVVPDLRDLPGEDHGTDPGRPTSRPEDRYRKALENLDKVLDRAFTWRRKRARTVVDRSDLRHIGLRHEKDASLPLTERFAIEEKRSVALLAANVLWALQRTDAQVVLASDRAVLADVLERMADIATDPQDQRAVRAAITARVTRVGLHADPWRAEGRIADDPVSAPAIGPIERAPERDRRRLTLDDLRTDAGDALERLQIRGRGLGSPHFLLLDGALARMMLGTIDSPHGRDRLVRLHQALADPRTVFEVVGHDPEDAGLRLRLLAGEDSAEDRDLEVTLAGALALDPEVLAELEAARTIGDLQDRIRVVLRGSPDLPCATPTLRVGAEDEDDSPTMLLVARVVGRTADGILVDIDGDVTTTEDQRLLAVPHGFTGYRGATMEVIVSDLDGDGRPDELVGPAPTSAAGAADGMPVVGTVISADRVRLDRTPDGGDEGPIEVELLGAPRSRGMTAAPGDRILVVPVSPTQCYAVSSALPHLN